MTTHARPLFPIRALIAPGGLWPEPLPADTLAPDRAPPAPALPALVVCRWPDGSRQLVSLVYEDALLGEARVRAWVRVGSRAEAVEQFVPVGWLS